MFKKLFKGTNNELNSSNELKKASINKIYTNLSLIIAFIATILIIIILVLPINTLLKPNATAPNTDKDSAFALSTPKYPKKIAYDDYEARNSRFSEINGSIINSISSFSINSAAEILTGEDKSKNDLYSPISLYMALSMLAETSEGSTREEILNTLKVDNIELLRSESSKVFTNLFIDNEIGKLNLANSIWLSNGYDFKSEALESLTKNYYAHSFSVDFGSNTTDKRISKWINEFTGGKLLKNTNDIKTTKEQVMILLNTIYFYDQWTNKFDTDKTKADKFYLENGKSIKCDFMNMEMISNSFIEDDKYTSSSLYFKNQNSMIFILPKEGVSPYDIMKDSKTLSEAINFNDSSNVIHGRVTFKIPKFNYASNLELNDGLKKLGINNVFDSSVADFSPLTNGKDLFVSKVKQEACISIDENGCEAAAYTQIDLAGASMPNGHADMILNRPFIFMITSTDNTPLFIGVINNPMN